VGGRGRHQQRCRAHGRGGCLGRIHQVVSRAEAQHRVVCRGTGVGVQPRGRIEVVEVLLTTNRYKAPVYSQRRPTTVTREVVMQPNPFACCIGMLSLCQVLYQYWFQWCRCTVHHHHTVEWFFSGAFFVSGFGFVETNWTDSEAASNFGLVVIHEFANLVSSLASQSNFIFRSSSTTAPVRQIQFCSFVI